jgi:hypothetical protein
MDPGKLTGQGQAIKLIDLLVGSREIARPVPLTESVS